MSALPRRGRPPGGGPAPELVGSGYAHEIDAAPRLAPWLSLADIAHAVALAEAGAIPADDARALLGGLLDLDAIRAADFPWRPELGDAFNSREAALSRARRAHGGRLAQRRAPAARGLPGRAAPVRPRGRPRPARRALDGAAALADLAERHAGDLAADYTYLQPAQPTTIGHLLLALRRTPGCATPSACAPPTPGST